MLWRSGAYAVYCLKDYCTGGWKGKRVIDLSAGACRSPLVDQIRQSLLLLFNNSVHLYELCVRYRIHRAGLMATRS
jgi:hypothetical protein